MICIRQTGKTCTLYTSSRSLAAAQQCQSPFAVQLEAVQQATPIASPKSIPFQASQKCLTKAARESPFSAKILKPCLQDKCCFGKQNPAKHSCQRRPGCKTRWQKVQFLLQGLATVKAMFHEKAYTLFQAAMPWNCQEVFQHLVKTWTTNEKKQTCARHGSGFQALYLDVQA